MNNQISNIQKIKNQQSILESIRNNIIYMNDSYDIKFACIKGISNNIHKDSIKLGYFEVLSEYSDLNEALKDLNLINNLLIDGKSYKIGMIYSNLNECNLSTDVYNLYTGQLVCKKDAPVKLYELDNIRTPKQMVSLYEQIEITKDFEFVEEDYDQDLNCNSVMKEMWDNVHSKLLENGLSEESLVIENLAYTKFII